MSLNNIALTDSIVVEWYKDTLLPLPGGLAASSTPTTPIPVAPPAAQVPAVLVTATLPPAPPQLSPHPIAEKQTAPASSPATAPARPQPAARTPVDPSALANPSPAPAPPPATTQALPAIPNTPAHYKILGNNRRHITLLVHSPGSGFMPDNQLTFLTKILEACRMTLADVAIVNNAAAPVTITALRQQLQPKIVLLFGVEPTAIRLPINFPPFKQLSYDDCTYLSSPALDQLVPDTGDSKLLKSKLWVCLKTLFDV